MKFITGEIIRHHPPKLKFTAVSVCSKTNTQNPAAVTPLNITTIDHARKDFTQTIPKNGEATMSKDKEGNVNNLNVFPE